MTVSVGFSPCTKLKMAFAVAAGADDDAKTGYKTIDHAIFVTAYNYTGKSPLYQNASEIRIYEVRGRAKDSSLCMHVCVHVCVSASRFKPAIRSHQCLLPV